MGKQLHLNMGRAHFRKERERANSLRVGISTDLQHGKASLTIFRNGISTRGQEGGVREERKEKNK